MTGSILSEPSPFSGEWRNVLSPPPLKMVSKVIDSKLSGALETLSPSLLCASTLSESAGVMLSSSLTLLMPSAPTPLTSRSVASGVGADFGLSISSLTTCDGAVDESSSIISSLVTLRLSEENSSPSSSRTNSSSPLSASAREISSANITWPFSSSSMVVAIPSAIFVMCCAESSNFLAISEATASGVSSCLLYGNLICLNVPCKLRNTLSTTSSGALSSGSSSTTTLV
mmetsp:Transcript_3436/g.13072  ORF Transcript_3436/g.13072 Transcript_3436/m.13072 type:complete len:229 (+) Transcript_3436:2674-3360(+)